MPQVYHCCRCTHPRTMHHDGGCSWGWDHSCSCPGFDNGDPAPSVPTGSERPDLERYGRIIEEARFARVTDVFSDRDVERLAVYARGLEQTAARLKTALDLALMQEAYKGGADWEAVEASLALPEVAALPPVDPT